MTDSKKELEEMVNQITEEVRRRLSNSVVDRTSSSVSSGSTVTSPCFATKENCEGSGRCATRKEPVVRSMLEEGACRFSKAPGTGPVAVDLAKYIDHTLLKQDATQEDLKKVCEEAGQHSFASVCVNASNIPFVARCLSGTSVMPIAVVGFPLGAGTPAAKSFEAREAVAAGAQEIDMVINIGALKSLNYSTVLEDIRAVVEASKPAPVKVILETGMLNNEEKVAGSVLAKSGGAAFVKTSTGFGPGGATVDDVKLMRSIVGPEMGVKASGGVRSQEDVLKMIDAGANRIGASASVAIVQGKKESTKVSPVPGQKQY